MFYFIIFAIFAAIAVLDFTNISKIQKVILYIMGLILFVVLGAIRWKTGSDWFNYAYYFVHNETWADYSRDVGFELGYKLINYSVRIFTDKYSFLLLVTTFIAVALKAVFFYKNVEYILLAIFAYYCFYYGDIFTTRQTLAISLCAISTIYIAKRQPLPFVIFVLLASMVHNTAIIYLISYVVFYRNYTNAQIILFLFLSIIIGVSGIIGKVLGPFASLISVLGTDGARMSDKIDFYSKTKDVALDISGGTNLILGILRRSFILPIFFLFRKRTTELYPLYTGFFNLFIFGNIIYFIFSSSILVFARAAYYYGIFEILLLIYIFQTIKSLKIKIAAYVLLLMYLLFKMYGGLANAWDLFEPFNTIFDTYIDRKLY